MIYWKECDLSRWRDMLPQNLVNNLFRFVELVVKWLWAVVGLGFQCSPNLSKQGWRKWHSCHQSKAQKLLEKNSQKQQVYGCNRTLTKVARGLVSEEQLTGFRRPNYICNPPPHLRYQYLVNFARKNCSSSTGPRKQIVPKFWAFDPDPNPASPEICGTLPKFLGNSLNCPGANERNFLVIFLSEGPRSPIWTQVSVKIVLQNFMWFFVETCWHRTKVDSKKPKITQGKVQVIVTNPASFHQIDISSERTDLRFLIPRFTEVGCR